MTYLKMSKKFFELKKMVKRPEAAKCDCLNCSAGMEISSINALYLFYVRELV